MDSVLHTLWPRTVTYSIWGIGRHGCKAWVNTGQNVCTGVLTWDQCGLCERGNM